MGPGRYNRPAASATRVSTGYGTTVQLLLLLNDNLGKDPLLLMTVAPKSYGRYTPPRNELGTFPWSSTNDADDRSVLVWPYDRIDRNVNGNATSGKLLVDELLLLLVVVLVVLLLFRVPEMLFVPPDAIESTLNKNVAGAVPWPPPPLAPSPSSSQFALVLVFALTMLPPPCSLIIILIIAVVAPDPEAEVSPLLLRVAIGLPSRADGLNFSDSTRSIPAKSEKPLLNLRDPSPCCMACACCCCAC